MKKAVIIGSCVTRDAFEFNKNTLDIKGSYFPRASIISLMSPSIEIDHKKLIDDNQWLKWVILNDYQKTTLSQASSVKPDVILIDLIDERFDILNIKKSYITMSDELFKINPLAKSYDQKDIIRRDSNEASLLFYKKAIDFCKKINTAFPKSKIIIHNARYSNYFMDKGRIIKFDKQKRYRNNLMNTKLESYVRILEEELINSTTITVSRELTIANKSHKWGLSPFHYIDEYYIEFMERVRSLTALGCISVITEGN